MWPAYTIEELMAVFIARDLKDGEKGLTGLASSDRTGELVVGIPLAAMGLAQQMQAPNLTILYGGVIVNPRLDEVPTLYKSGASLHRVRSAAQLTPTETLMLARRGEIDFGFASGYQVDRYGNTNITCIGPYDEPEVRLLGAVLQTEHFSLFGREYIIMDHHCRCFVECVDFITGAGYLGGAYAREMADLSPDGPRWVVTDLAVLGFNAATRRMQLESLHPGVCVEQVIAQTGFELLIPDDIPVTPPPEARELDLLRRRVDPHSWLLPRRG